MKVIAAKQIMIASLRELQLMLDKWVSALRKLGALSQTTTDLRKQHRQTLDRINQLNDVRNCAFHFGDPLESPDNLVKLYEAIREFDLDNLNEMLRILYDLILQLRQDALLTAERLDK